MIDLPLIQHIEVTHPLGQESTIVALSFYPFAISRDARMYLQKAVFCHSISNGISPEWFEELARSLQETLEKLELKMKVPSFAICKCGLPLTIRGATHDCIETLAKRIAILEKK